MPDSVLTQLTLDNLNVPQGRQENRAYLDSLGGVDALVRMIGTNLDTGLNQHDVLAMRERFGDNSMPTTPTQSYIWLLYVALTDLTLIILSAAAAVSFAVGYYEDPEYGWIEAVAIFIAVFLVSNISAFNGYTKELQFRELERASQMDETVSVMRDGKIEQINPAELVVGDLIILQVLKHISILIVDCGCNDDNYSFVQNYSINLIVHLTFSSSRVEMRSQLTLYSSTELRFPPLNQHLQVNLKI